jgi:hypothetical protein
MPIVKSVAHSLALSDLNIFTLLLLRRILSFPPVHPICFMLGIKQTIGAWVGPECVNIWLMICLTVASSWGRGHFAFLRVGASY